jgi:hypothetical protein
MNRGLHIWTDIENFISAISFLPALGMFAAVMWVVYHGYLKLTRLEAGMDRLKRTKVRVNVLILCVLLFACFKPSYATTVHRLSFDDLVSKSQSIVSGRAIDTRTYRSADGKLILTSYTFEVEQTLKGGAASTVVITTIGGRVGNTILHVAGMPSFSVGENAVVFLERSGAYNTVVGLTQGKFSVVNGEVANSISGLSFSDNAPGQPLRMALDEFKHQIQLRLGK